MTRVGAVAADVAAPVTESFPQRSRCFDKMRLYVFCISVKIDTVNSTYFPPALVEQGGNRSNRREIDEKK